MTAQSNKERMLQIFAELSEGRGRTLMATLSDDIRWTVIGSTRYSGVFHGKEQVRALAAGVGQRLVGPIVFTPLLCVADGEHVVLQVDGKATTRTGRPYENRYCMIARFVDGRIAEFIEYNDTELITTALGTEG